MKTTVTVLPTRPAETWAEKHMLNPARQLLLLDVNSLRSETPVGSGALQVPSTVTRASQRLSGARDVVSMWEVPLQHTVIDTTPVTERTSELKYTFAWSGRTLGSRRSQCTCWLMFCQGDAQIELPITEGSLQPSLVGSAINESKGGVKHRALRCQNT
jgi:hypothetical protein